MRFGCSRSCLLLFLALAACAKPEKKAPSSTSAVPEAQGTPATQEADANAQEAGKKNAEERVDPPTKISGALLHCAVVSDAGRQLPEVALGCRFDDEKGNRVPLVSLAETVTFSVLPPIDASVKVAVLPLEDISSFDVAYVFQGPSRDIALETAKLTQVNVSFEGVADGSGPTSISALIEEVLVESSLLLTQITYVATESYAMIKTYAVAAKQAGIASFEDAKDKAVEKTAEFKEAVEEKGSEFFDEAARKAAEFAAAAEAARLQAEADAKAKAEAAAVAEAEAKAKADEAKETSVLDDIKDFFGL